MESDIAAEIRRIRDELGPPPDVVSMRLTPVLWAKIREAFKPVKHPGGWVDPFGMQVSICPHRQAVTYDGQHRVSGVFMGETLIQIPPGMRWVEPFGGCNQCSPPKPEEPETWWRRLLAWLRNLGSPSPDRGGNGNG